MKTRNSQRQLEVRDNRRLVFYPAVFDEPTTVFDFKPGEKERSEYVEVVRPGSFAHALEGDGEVIANIDHDAGRTFAKRSDGSLLLQEDPRGLFASAWLPEDALGDAIIKDIEAGIITGCSFRFDTLKDRWSGQQCELLAVNLVDVCVTGKPAYPGTEVVHMRTRNTLRGILARLALAKFKTSRLHTLTTQGDR